MKSLNPRALSAFLFLLPACGQQMVDFRNPDGGKSDAALPDRPSSDGVGADLTIADALNVDGIGDTALPDGQNRDAADAELPAVDTLLSDSANQEARDVDLGNNDVRIIDASSPDVRVIDALTVDESGTDAPALDISKLLPRTS